MSKESKLVREEIELGLEDREAGKEPWKPLIEEIQSAVYATGSPEDFYAHRGYERVMGEKIEEVAKLAAEAFYRKNFTEVIEIGKGLLRACGVEGAKNASVALPSHAVALAEAVNLAAKSFFYEFYAMKPLMIVAASQLEGVHFGLGEDDAYYLGTETIGVASFHSPLDDIGDLYSSLGLMVPQWDHPWSGVERQPLAFKILEDSGKHHGMAAAYAEATSTDDFKTVREKYLRGYSRMSLEAMNGIFEQIEDQVAT